MTSKRVGEDKGPGIVSFLQLRTAPKFPLADTWVLLWIPQSFTGVHISKYMFHLALMYIFYI